MPGMKRFSKLLKGGSAGNGPSTRSGGDGGDGPEASASRGVRLFCESASPTNAGEEVLHLPVIVEAAESSPAAAASAALQIRKFLSRDNYARPHVQYNAIMLIRILADNPGPSFTRNVDDKFVDAVKLLLRHSRDPSVQQIMRETLNAFEEEKAYDENLGPLIAMWTKERGVKLMPPQQTVQRQTHGQMNAYGGLQGGPQTTFNTYNAARWAGQQAPARPPNSSRTHSNTSQLPSPVELASRIEEARSSANLLMQLSSSTPAAEAPSNDLLQEFSTRCQTAQRSLEGYMNCTNPAPDENTFQTLIETCEQLSLANSRYQRAILAGRREIGNVVGNGGNPVYPPQVRAPSLGKAPPEPSGPSGPSISVPVPPSSMRQQLQTRLDTAGPSSSRLYPSPPAAPVANPFEEETELPAHPLPVELEGSPASLRNDSTSQTPIATGYNPTVRQRPPIPIQVPSEPQTTPLQYLHTSRSSNVHPSFSPKTIESTIYTEDGGLYDEPPSTNSAAVSSCYPSPVSATTSSDPWIAQKQHWANVTAAASGSAPAPATVYDSEPRFPSPAMSGGEPNAVANSARNAPPSQFDLFKPTQPMLPHHSPPSSPTALSQPPQRQNQSPPPPPPFGTFRTTPSYLHRQDVAVHSLTMSGGAGGTSIGNPTGTRGEREEEGRDAIDEERRRRSWRDFPSTRPVIPSSWGEESYVGGSGGVRDV